MKLISLNVWGGRMSQELTLFVRDHKDIDVFCFQEVYHEAQGKDTTWLDGTNFNLFRDLKEALPEYEAFYNPHLGDWWGLGMFIKKDIEILGQGEVYVHTPAVRDLAREMQGYTAKNLQYATIKTPAGPRMVMNFHGLWNGGGKADCDERLVQSENIIAFAKTVQDPYVLAGDFNLNPETVSIEMLEGAGMRNLIKEFGVTSTRTVLYTKDNRYADYAFASGGIETLDFSVLPDVVSDHSPLYLEFI